MRQASDEEHELERQKPGVKAAETTESQEQSNKSDNRNNRYSAGSRHWSRR